MSTRLSPASKTTLIIFLISRAALAGWILVFAWFAAQANPPYGPGASLAPPGPASEGWVNLNLVQPWHRWDTVHYIQVALEGYQRSENTAWPPLFPLLVFMFNLAAANPVLAALLVSNLAVLGAYWLLFRLVAEDFNPQTARNTLVWMTVYPAGFFLAAGYSESLFLLLGVGALWAARRGRFWMAAGLAALTALVRVLGLLLLIPIAWEAAARFGIFNNLRENKGLALTLKALLPSLPQLLPLAAIPLPYAVFAVWVHFGLNAPWPWQTISSGWEQSYAAPWSGIIGNLTALGYAAQGYPVPLGTTLLDLMAAALGAGLLITGYRRLPFSYTLLAGVMLVASLSKVTNGNLLVSTSRYLVPLFPLFVTQALTWNNRWLRLGWLGFSLALQAILLVVFWLGFWVG